MAVKIIDKTQLNSSSLQKVSASCVWTYVLIMHLFALLKQNKPFRVYPLFSSTRLDFLTLDPRSLELLSSILEMLDFDFAQGQRGELITPI